MKKMLYLIVLVFLSCANQQITKIRSSMGKIVLIQNNRLAHLNYAINILTSDSLSMAERRDLIKGDSVTTEMFIRGIK